MKKPFLFLLLAILSIALIGSVGASNNLTIGLLACYDFDGNANDYFGRYNGTIVGSPSYVTGKLGQAIDIGDIAVDEYVNISTFFNLTNNYQMFVWWKPRSSGEGGNGRLFDTSKDATAGVRMFTDSNTFYAQHVGVADTTYQSYSDKFGMGVWNNILVGYNTTNGTMYFNASADINDKSVTKPLQPSSSMIIGNAYTHNYNINASIDTMVFFSRQLNSSERTSIYNSGVGITCSEILHSGDLYKIYYICSNASDDSHTGLDIDYPKKTISGFNSLVLNVGDTVKFCKGGMWNLVTDAYPSFSVSGSSSSWINYTSYGSGSVRPLFIGAYNMSVSGNWSDNGGNIWNSSGNISQDVGNIWFNQGTISGYKQSALSGVDTQGDFFYNTTTDRVYLYSTSNPATYYTEVYLAGWLGTETAMFQYSNRQFLEFNGLELKYQGYTGMDCRECSSIRRINNTIYGMGGVYQSGTLRYGDCMITGLNNNNIYDAYNNISECWDSCLGTSSWSGAGAKNIYNHLWEYNTLSHCAFGMGIFNGNVNSTTNNITWSHNTIIEMGYGKIGAQTGREGGRGMTAHTIYNWSNHTIKDNIFFNSSFRDFDFIASIYTYTGFLPNLTNNLHYFSSGADYLIWNGSNYGNLTLWKAATGFGLNDVQLNTSTLFYPSTFNPLSSSIACTMSSTGSYVGALPCAPNIVPEPVTNLQCPFIGTTSIWCNATLPTLIENDYNYTEIWRNGVNIINLTGTLNWLNDTPGTNGTTYRYDWIVVDDVGAESSNATITNTTYQSNQTYTADNPEFIRHYTGYYSSNIVSLTSWSIKYLNVTFLQKPFIVNAWVTNNYTSLDLEMEKEDADSVYCHPDLFDCGASNDANLGTYTVAGSEDVGDWLGIYQNFTLNSTFLGKIANLNVSWGAANGDIRLYCYSYDTLAYTYIGMQDYDPGSFTAVETSFTLNNTCLSTTPLRIQLDVRNRYGSGQVNIKETRLSGIRTANASIEYSLYQNRTNESNWRETTNITAIARDKSADAFLLFAFENTGTGQIDTNISINVIYNMSINFTILDWDTSRANRTNASCLFNSASLGRNWTFQVYYNSSISNIMVCSEPGFSNTTYNITFPYERINLTLNRVQAFECTGAAGESFAYNFTVMDEDNKTLMGNNSIYVDLDFGLNTLSFQKFNTAFVQLCTQTGQSFTVNGFVQIDQGYSTKYFLTDAIYDDTLRTVNVYNENDVSYHSSLIMTVRDQTYMPTSDIIVKMWRYYPANHTWIIIQQDRTGEFGTAFFSIIEENTEYKFSFYRNATLLDDTNPLKLKCTSSVCEVSFVLSPEEEDQSSFDTGIYYDNSTNLLTVSWSDATGATASVRTKVTKETFLSTDTISDTTTYSSSGSVDIDLSSYSGTIEVNVYTNGDSVPTLNQLLTLDSEIIGDFLTIPQQGFMSVMILLVFIGMGIISPVAVILMSLIALFLISILGLNPIVNITFVIIATVIGVIIGSKVE